jgi:hypothetical protein
MGQQTQRQLNIDAEVRVLCVYVCANLIAKQNGDRRLTLAASLRNLHMKTPIRLCKPRLQLVLRSAINYLHKCSAFMPE